MIALLQLAERCEKATGPDRELDIAIATGAAGWRHQPHVAHNFKWHDGRFDVPGPPPKFTASLDAAITLVRGKDIWDVTSTGTAWVESDYDGTQSFGNAATPALALCAAALRARAAA